MRRQARLTFDRVSSPNSLVSPRSLTASHLPSAETSLHVSAVVDFFNSTSSTFSHPPTAFFPLLASLPATRHTPSPPSRRQTTSLESSLLLTPIVPWSTPFSPPIFL